MGQITMFSKDPCPYCDKVQRALQELIDAVLVHCEEQDEKEGMVYEDEIVQEEQEQEEEQEEQGQGQGQGREEEDGGGVNTTSSKASNNCKGRGMNGTSDAHKKRLKVKRRPRRKRKRNIQMENSGTGMDEKENESDDGDDDDDDDDGVIEDVEIEKERIIKRPEIRLVLLKAEGANAALCLRLTGKATVPHIFFQESYVGDATTFCLLDEAWKRKEEDGGCPVLFEKVVGLARMPMPDPPFPPPASASLVKITEHVACSSQPTKEQLENLRCFGIASVINLVRPDARTFEKREGELVSQQGVHYHHYPICVITPENIMEALKLVDAAPKPVLVHDDAGHRAGLVVLLQAGIESEKERIKNIGPQPTAQDSFVEQVQPKEASVDVETVLGWGSDLGFDFTKEASVIRAILEKLL